MMATTQTDFKTVPEEPAEAEDGDKSEKSKTVEQTIEENYRETVELVKKYIHVEVPSLGSTAEKVIRFPRVNEQQHVVLEDNL